MIAPHIPCLLLLLSLTPWASAQWQNVSVTGNPSLNVVRYASPTTAYAAGLNGVILKSTDTGATWAPLTSGTTAFLYGMHFVGSSVGWVSGSGGVIRKTIDGGTTWNPQTTGTTKWISDLHFINSNVGWAVGDEGLVLKTINGATWNPQTSGTIQNLNAVFFTDANTGWIAGGGNQIRKSTDGGTSWTMQDGGGNTTWNSLFFLNANTGWVVGSSGAVKHTTDGGATWQTRTGFVKDTLMEVRFYDDLLGWIVSTTGTIYVTQNGGKTWQAQKTGRFVNLNSADFASTGAATCVGLSGAHFRFFRGSSLGRLWAEHMVKTGQPVPAPVSATYQSFGSAVVNGSGNVAFASTLRGADATAGRNRALLRNHLGVFRFLARSKTSLDGAILAGNPGPFVMNQTQGWFLTPVSGPGISSRNNQMLVMDNGTALFERLRKGDLLSGLGGAGPDVELGGIGEVLQHPTLDAIAVSYSLRRDLATGVNARNDSGLLFMNHAGTLLAKAEREGAPVPMDVGPGVFNQFTGRAALYQAEPAHFGCQWTPDGEKPRPAIFFTNTSGSFRGLTASAGEDAGLGDPAITLRSFTAWTKSGAACLFRSTITGPGVNSSNNEIIRRGPDVWLRKGVTLVGPGLTVKRILRFWPVQDSQMVVLVQLSGPGVNSSNNTALLLRQSDASFRLLMRTGLSAPGIPEAGVSAIQAVEVRPNGSYAILAGLRGVAKDVNQALWTGFTLAGTNNLAETGRLPIILVRKGAAYRTSATSSGRVRAILFRPTTDRSGTGGRGLGEVISGGNHTLFFIQGDNRIIEMVRYGT